MVDSSGAYLIHMRFIKAANVPASDHKPFQKPTSDPFVAAYFEGNWGKKGLVAYSTVVEDNLSPVWPDIPDNRKTLQGVSTGTDVLVLDLWDKDHKQFADDGFTVYKKCDKIATGSVRISTVKFGKNETIEVPLRNLISKKGHSKHGGVLTVLLNVVPPGTPPFTEVDFKPTGYKAAVYFRSAKDLPAADRPFLRAPTSDPYVVAKIRGAPESTKKQTSVANNTLNPTWNETRTFIYQNSTDVLELVVWDHDKSTDDDKLAVGELSFDGLQPGRQHEFNDYPLTCVWKKGPATSPKLSFSVSIVEVGEGEEDPDPQICKFDWGALNSSYSTSFSSYDTAHGCHGLGEPTPDELEVPEGYHVHVIHTDEPKVEHPKAKVSGTVSEVRTTLPRYSVAVFQLKHGKLKKKNEPEAASGSIEGTGVNLPFHFKVKKGSFVGVVLYDESKTVVAIAKKKTKTIEGGEQTLALPLVKAPDFKGSSPPGGYGTATIKVLYEVDDD